LASNTKKRKAQQALKKAKLERNKSDLVTLASRRREKSKDSSGTAEGKD
jgi:hypothetical protein